MRQIKQWLKKVLAEFLDLNIVILGTNLIILIFIFWGSTKYGDFIQFLQYLENNLQITITVIFLIILFMFFVFKVVIPSILKKTIGQAFFYVEYIPKSNVNILNLFLFNITGPITNILLFPVSIIRTFKKLPSIGAIISQIHLNTVAVSSYIKFMLGFLILFVLTGLNLYTYNANLFFNIGKRLTNYERLMDYAIQQQNPDMLNYFINEYKHQTQRDPDYYECILSLFKNGINEKACNQALASDPNERHQQLLHKYIGLHYFALNDYKNAAKYLEYFYQNQILSEDLITYLYSYEKLDTSYNHKNTIDKINKIYKQILSSNNVIIQYKTALILFDNQQFNKAIEILQKLAEKQSPLLDKSEVLWYLGEALFLSKKYDEGLKYMKQAQKLNPVKYKTLYESYKSYYKTQVKK